MKKFEAGQYDVIVVGAGHAGAEAAAAPAKMGLKTALITIDLDSVANMPCNPSIGGPAKGIVVREVDALGGLMGQVIDKTYIQMRMLNTAKGPAVRALRAQADKHAYSAEMKKTLEEIDNLSLRQGIVDEVLVEDGKVTGVVLSTGAIFRAQAVILCAGTSSRGRIIIGDLAYSSGPNHSLPSIKLSENLLDLGFNLERFKTGTPPRVHQDTIDFSKTEEQPGDEEVHHFSYTTPDSAFVTDQISCWLTYTNEDTHELLRDNLDSAPMFTGIVEGVGARYCPSIEDKIVRFSDKPRHQVFLEPEGRNTKEYYCQGISTSMPESVQYEMLRSIKGLENAEMMRPGYAIEYDVVKPDQLKASLETKLVEGLYTAGQMNGTSGYEEAAGQGIMAGINAALKIKGQEPLILNRDQAYIGVMIDDLVTKGTTEPYRLLTSRAEFRLLLRHDNADFRLTDMAYDLGLISEDRYQAFQEKRQELEAEIDRLQNTRLKPTDELNDFVLERGADYKLKDGILAYDLLRRPEIKYEDILHFAPADQPVSPAVAEQVEIRCKYEGYIKKAIRKAEKMKRLEDKEIPENIDYQKIDNIATEALERLEQIRPRTIAQASRISGVTPADVSILSVYIEQGKYQTISN